MAYPGIIYRIGTPKEVISEDLIRYVYGMNSKIVDDCGRPHVILQNPLSEEEVKELRGTILEQSSNGDL